MAVPFLLALHGQLTIVGKSPDGDSIRFIPDSPDALSQLQRADRIRISSSDGSVQLRLEGIDTPETHSGPSRSRSASTPATGCSSTPASATSASPQTAPSRRQRRRRDPRSS